MRAETETDVLAGLDFDAELPCESHACRDGWVSCSVTARWRVRLACCGTRFVACDAYRAYRLKPGHWFFCRCGAQPQPVPTFAPIGGVA